MLFPQDLRAGRGDPGSGPPPAADDTATPTVIVQPEDFRLPAVLKHIEAGKVVLVMPHHHGDD
ncbi:hypothetical protein ACQP2X_12875 [Actinoplanes sp. CA-131856]